MGYYASKNKKQIRYERKRLDYNSISKIIDDELRYSAIRLSDFKPPFAIEDEACIKIFDDWKNSVANINLNNSIIRHSEFIENRLTYMQCASLYADANINNAISTISKDCIGNKGIFEIVNQDDSADFRKIIDDLEVELENIDFWNSIKKAIETSLTYGGCLIYLDVNTDDYSKLLAKGYASVVENKLQGIRVLEPWSFAPLDVNTSMVLSKDYMKPKKWNIMGAGAVHSTRVIPLTFFEAPNLTKPLYNMLGISICQFMYNAVRNSETMGESLSDIFLRFRTDIIKTGQLSINEEEVIERAKANNKLRNNLSTLILQDGEEYIQTITSLSGLDKLVAQAMEKLAISARIPAVKLLGISPSGFNATGDFDLKNYYDIIEGYQKSILESIILEIAQMVLYGLGYNYKLKFKFNPIAQENALEKANKENLIVSYLVNLVNTGIISQEQAFEFLQSKEILFNNFKFDDSLEVDLLNTNDIETGFNI